ncbi:Aldo/keto reductase [Abortiporus biennis]|nr:Aldo/keto reductase [Abortiporus biennis]
MATPVPYFSLNNGLKIPAIGMGCWMGDVGGGPAVEEMCANALKNGYRHLDTVRNEEHVGKAVRESGIPRNEIFVTTKLWNDCHHKVKEAFEQSLNNLGLDYIDLYLMHWPMAQIDGPEEHPTIVDTWKEMEKLLETGKVKSIGVSNFGIKPLKRLLSQCKVVPVTNQVESHPCLPYLELKNLCEDNGILITAYSPLGQSNRVFLADPDMIKIAESHQVTPAQVAMSWAVQRGTVAIPKSANLERMRQNISLVTLSDKEMDLVTSLHKKPGMHRSLLAYHHDGGVVFGWTYKQLDWPMDKGGFVIDQE